MIITIGDLHKDFNQIKNFVSRFKIENTIFVQVGDFGVGFNPNDFEILTDLNSFLVGTGNKLIACRGNHDNPAYFGNFSLSNLELVGDYVVRNLLGFNFLFIGGAISIDRKHSQIKEKISWWKDEKIEFAPEKILSITEKIDYLIFHTAPDFVAPRALGNLVKQYAVHDETLIQELLEERKKVSEIYNLVKERNPDLKKVFYGHFHFSNEEEIGGTIFQLLNVNEFNLCYSK